MSQCQPGSTRPFPLQVPRQPQVWMRGTCAGEALLCCALLWFPFTGFEVARAPLEHHTLLLTPLLGTSSPFPSPSGPRLGLTQFSRAFQPGLWVCKQSGEKQGHSRDTAGTQLWTLPLHRSSLLARLPALFTGRAPLSALLSATGDSHSISQGHTNPGDRRAQPRSTHRTRATPDPVSPAAPAPAGLRAAKFLLQRAQTEPPTHRWSCRFSPPPFTAADFGHRHPTVPVGACCTRGCPCTILVLDQSRRRNKPRASDPCIPAWLFRPGLQQRAAPAGTWCQKALPARRSGDFSLSLQQLRSSRLRIQPRVSSKGRQGPSCQRSAPRCCHPAACREEEARTGLFRAVSEVPKQRQASQERLTPPLLQTAPRLPRLSGHAYGNTARARREASRKLKRLAAAAFPCLSPGLNTELPDNSLCLQLHDLDRLLNT